MLLSLCAIQFRCTSALLLTRTATTSLSSSPRLLNNYIHTRSLLCATTGTTPTPIRYYMTTGSTDSSTVTSATTGITPTTVTSTTATGTKESKKKSLSTPTTSSGAIASTGGGGATASTGDKEKGKKKGSEEGQGKYSKTVRLPVTSFDQRANSVKREPEIQKYWKDYQIYENLAEQNIGEKFILHDGPPYANGDLHIGHALNKILKDMINKYQTLQGRKVRYIPGWDCHGLPIELKG